MELLWIHRDDDGAYKWHGDTSSSVHSWTAGTDTTAAQQWHQSRGRCQCVWHVWPTWQRAWPGLQHSSNTRELLTTFTSNVWTLLQLPWFLFYAMPSSVRAFSRLCLEVLASVFWKWPMLYTRLAVCIYSRFTMPTHTAEEDTRITSFKKFIFTE